MHGVQLPGLYLETFNSPFQLEDFGVCELADLLSDVPEGNKRFKFLPNFFRSSGNLRRRYKPTDSPAEKEPLSGESETKGVKTVAHSLKQ